jgi:hypothetical protein
MVGNDAVNLMDIMGKLAWSDFQGKPPESHGPEAAHIHTEVESDATPKVVGPVGPHGCVTVSTKYARATAKVDKKLSWVRPGMQSLQLLNHEEGHFNISKLIAKTLQDLLWKVEVTMCRNCANPEPPSIADQAVLEWRKRIDDLEDKYINDRESIVDNKGLNQAMQDAYDEETSHSQNTAAQAAWDKHLRARVNRMPIPQAPPTPPGMAGF